MSSVYIQCEVLPGLFDSEYYVLVNGSSAYYINRSQVQVKQEPAVGQSVAGRVLGYLVEQSQGKTLVQLTGEAVVGGLRTWVEDSAVKVA